jgi:hypothetical protein
MCSSWDYVEVGGQAHAPATLPLREGAPGSHQVGTSAGSRAALDAVMGIEHWSSIFQTVAIPIELSQLLATDQSVELRLLSAVSIRTKAAP